MMISDKIPVNYPAVVISQSCCTEVIRRTVICRVQAGLTNTEVMSSNIARTVQRGWDGTLSGISATDASEIVPNCWN